MRERMVKTVLVMLCWVVLTVEGDSERCETFGDKRLSSKQSRIVWCYKNCTTGHVFGTGVYHKDSVICQAALHSGVITSLDTSTRVNITRLRDGSYSAYGTAQNRIVSGDFPRLDSAYKVESTKEEKGVVVVDEVLMVHNGVSSNAIQVTCLSQDKVSLISSSNLQSWNYENRPASVQVKSGNNSARLVFIMDKNLNHHAMRLLGSRRDKDVLALVQYPEAMFQAKVATLRASVGDNVTFDILSQESLGRASFRRLPSPSWVPAVDLPFHLVFANVSNAGIYMFGTGKQANRGAYVELVIRDCQKGFYGWECSKPCPECLNGGQCHSHLGTCVCPPGFIGDKCQFACPPGWFGNDCQFKCDRQFQGVPDESAGVANEQEQGNCKDLTICQPHPYGCSCAAGFTHPTQPGHTCSAGCPKGHYGADCEQICSDCSGEECDPYSGTCTIGCKPRRTCKHVPSLNIRVTRDQQGYEASWRSIPQARYFFSQQELHSLSCPTTHKQFESHSLIVSKYRATDLSHYTSYNVCVMASSPQGLSKLSCSVVTTLPAVPDVRITRTQCQEGYIGLTCSAEVSGSCKNYNGPNVIISFILHSNLSCSHHLSILNKSVELTGNRVSVTFVNYLAGEKYQVTAMVQNTAGIGHTLTPPAITTQPKPPLPVQHVDRIEMSEDAIQLQWNDSCPSNGGIKYWAIIGIDGREQKLYQNDLHCAPEYKSSHHCYIITGLELGEEYNIRLQQVNDAGRDSGYEFPVKIVEREPDSPQNIRTNSSARQLNLTLVPPRYHGGKLLNCSISLTASQKKCIFDLRKKTEMNCTIDGLEEGRKYEASAFCCNTKFCGKKLKMHVATRPVPPKLSSFPTILRKTNSTVTLGLPDITPSKEGNNSLIVFVQQETQNQEVNLEEEVKKLLNEHHQPTRRKRSSLSGQCNSLWIAAKLDQGEKEFVVGDGKTYKGFVNCPLKLGQAYNIGIMGENELLGLHEYSELKVERGIVVKPDQFNHMLLLILLLLLLILPLGLLVYYRHHMQSTDKTLMNEHDISQETAASLEMENIMGLTPPYPVTKDSIENEAIYENLKPGATDSQVPYAEVEAYLNKVIGSMKAKEDFGTVPRTLNKSMAVAQLPENKAKNRFKNNLPYDDTRVVLSSIGGDPSSDYINASHVQGFRNMRYIATQGPKDTKVCTIADFWRMVVEQHINAIIMVANFVEMGKKKVGEYFIPGQTLNFDGFEVVVNSTEMLPHFTVSSLLVSWGRETYKVQHYHYIKWPDHGIPTEAISIAEMLTFFQSHHTEGGTVVHCSAGIGRTGTVLQVLLMCEMLDCLGYLNPLEVLGRLRLCRSRLVDNEAQYNLSLEILEEILFGKKTVMSTCDLLNHLEKCVHTSRTQYAMAKFLPSPLTYATSSSPDFQPLNRSASILPADNNRFFLQPKAGVKAELSQYINAIRVPGLNKQEFMLATEHPLPHTVANFWRLVAEAECTLVIFINSLENHEENEYPTMLWESGKVWQAGDYQLCVEKTEPYGTWFRHTTLTIALDKWNHRIDVYQSVQWSLGSPLPPSPLLLLTLAELLQTPRGQTAGPPLLCCGDGVTGCGLVAGMTLIVQRLQSEQVVDVYRTVVKLLRARQQFITSEEQFSMLYTGAAIYLQEYSNYGNFQ